TPLEQFEPRRAKNEHRDVAYPVDEVLDEVEQPFIRPLDVLEDQHERVLLRQRLEETAPRRERLLLRPGGVGRLPDQRPQVRYDPLDVLVEQLLDCRAQLRAD